MKNKNRLIFPIMIIFLAFSACERNSGNLTGEENLNKNESYALGMSVGAEFLESMDSGQVSPNIDEFLKGLSDIMKGKPTRFDLSEAIAMLDTAFTSLMENRNEESAQEERTFLAENARKPGIIITSSGLQYEIVREGTGPKPSADNLVRVHYKGSLIDGTVFDSSYSYGEPVDFYLYQVIYGWSEGLQLMSVGSHYKFYIPSSLGYGPSGRPPIPPNATLIFEVELLSIIEE